MNNRWREKMVLEVLKIEEDFISRKCFQVWYFWLVWELYGRKGA